MKSESEVVLGKRQVHMTAYVLFDVIENNEKETQNEFHPKPVGSVNGIYFLPSHRKVTSFPFLHVTLVAFS